MPSVTNPSTQTFHPGFCTATIKPAHTFRLGEILVRHGSISKEQLEQVILAQAQQTDCHFKYKLGEMLLSKKMITTQELRAGLKEQFWRNHGFWVID